MKQGRRILVTGGTGFVGNRLVNALVAHGDTVSVVTRHPEAHRSASSGVEYVGWLPDLARYQAVVNLAGEPVVGRRWNAAVLEEIRASRVDRTRELVVALAKTEKRPRVLVNASAIGFYGDRGDEPLPESASTGPGALSAMAADWEREALRAEELGVRTVVVRIGVVLGRDGGALQQLLPVFRLGLGGPIGDGRAWFSWIHWRDLVSLLVLALDREDLHGPLNGVAPGAVTNREFTRALARAVHRPAILPVPRFALALRFGGAAKLLTEGQRVVPRRAEELGFRFQFPDVDAALADLLA